MTAATTASEQRGHGSPGSARQGSGASSRPRTAVGAFFLATAGVHVGIVAADPSTYASFADAALLDPVRTGWDEVFMARPAVWGLLLALGEATLGILLLASPRTARAGWVGVLLFHLTLMLFGFGFGFWAYAVPALALLLVLARHDLRGGT